ncbi:pentapeptide repeat-containing protein [Trichocoleus desertorum]|uniref:Pentapeptide repeat-containing protein n=1 Tax=Trichocoleus desertorum GB2-A4 TaxID=2933944 RepID=A0ABV0JE64_9CYAN|nr:pentapeptide repeat-containing protein [Trichocoleus sp. FACHB-46]
MVIILMPWALWKVPQWQVEPLQQQIDALRSPTSKASMPRSKPVDPEKIAALEKSRIDAENATRSWLIQGVVGIFAAATAFIAWLNYQATQEKQVAERFSKSIEQLGSDNIHVRLGGIYALEQIAKDAEEKYYWQVMETLTAYVREKSPYPPKTEKKPTSFIQVALQKVEGDNFASQPNIPPLPLDIQAVMTLLARRKHTYGHKLEPHRLNLRAVDLRRLHLPPTAQLSSADLSGSSLQQAELAGINFQQAELSDANLQQVELTGANLQEAKFCSANLQWAKLCEANLRQAKLQGADLQGVTLLRSNLYQACLVQACLISAHLTGANLKQAELEGANLQDARLWFANLAEINLIQANLQNADLIGTNLQEADLREANLQSAFLMGANLRGVSFVEANLEQVRFAWPGLQRGIGVKGLIPDRYRFDRPAKRLAWSQLQQAKSYKGAVLPYYLLKQPQSTQAGKDKSPR